MSYLSPNDSGNRQNQKLIQIRETEEDEFFQEQQLYQGAQLQKMNIQFLNSQVNHFKQINKRNEDEVESIQQLTNNYFMKTNPQQESAGVTQNSKFLYDIQNSGFSNSNKSFLGQNNFRNIESHIFEQIQLHQVTFSKQQEKTKAKSIEELNINESKLQNIENKYQGQQNIIDESYRFITQDLSTKKNNTERQNIAKQKCKNQQLRSSTYEFKGVSCQNQTPSQRLRIAYQVFEFKQNSDGISIKDRKIIASLYFRSYQFLIELVTTFSIIYCEGSSKMIEQDSWIKHANLKFEQSQNTLYLYSFNFSWTTLLTIGYGDIVPVSNSEKIYGEKITSQFNNKIQSKLKSEVHLQYFLKNQIQKNTFTKEFLTQLTCKMKEVLLLPDQIIQKSGEPTNRLQIIQKGQIKSVFEPSQDLVIDIYKYQTLLKLQQTKKIAKQKRMDLILQEQQEDKAILDIYEDIRKILEWSDKQFLLRIPAFKIFQNQILIDYEDGDEIDDEESDYKTNNKDLQKSSVLNSEQPPSIVENMRKQQKTSKDLRLFMAQYRNSFKDSRDNQRRISELLAEDYQQSQKSNQHKSFNESIPLSSNFIQSYFRLGSSQKDIQVYQPQSSKNLILNKQNSLSSSQVLILQGGRAIRKSDAYNSAIMDSSHIIQRKNKHEEKRNSLLIQYNINVYQSKVQPSNKKIILEEQQNTYNYLNMNTFENDFDLYKEVRIFFPQHNLSRVIKIQKILILINFNKK
ncbi:hypothetical protein ABPG72_007669 [Tetrahymena utriculariae]